MLTMSRLIIFAAAFAGLSIAHAANPREGLKQLTAQLQNNPGDSDLREKIIKLAQTVKPAPAIPEEAERRMARGIAGFQGAKSVSDYQSAASEFEKAANVAPWYGDAYYNLGLSQDKAGNHAGALQSLKFAALASPGNREIKNLMYQVEYRRDQANAKAQAAENVARALEPLRGNWNALWCTVNKDRDSSIDTGCTEDEIAGANWQRIQDWFNGGVTAIYEFKFNSDNTVEIDKAYLRGPYGLAKKVVGTPNGNGEIDWVCHYESDTRTNRAWASYFSGLVLSCDRPTSGGSYSERYHYKLFLRPK